MDYKETIKERLKVLPEQLRAFVLDENWRRDAEKIGKQFGLDEEKYASFENEVFFVLLCFEPPADFVGNITRELGVDVNTAKWIEEDVEKDIFSKVANEISAVWQAADAGSEEEQGETEIVENVESDTSGEASGGVGGSFEQIILNQAKAMQPARLASESVAGGPAREVPENLPTGGQNQSEQPKVIHNYINESDPYREPLA